MSRNRLRFKRRGPMAASEAAHDFYNELRLRSDAWSGKTLSYRDQTAINAKSLSGSPNTYVTYSPGTDTDPQKQDAARVVIPPWNDGGNGTLAANIPNTTDLTFSLSHSGNYGGLNAAGQAVKIDNEFMIVTTWTGTNPSTVTVSGRGAYGTSAATHTSGATVKPSYNGLQNQVRIPLGTANGNTYLFTWDHLWTDSWMSCGLSGHKGFLFYPHVTGAKWLEFRPIYDGSYNSGIPSVFTPGTHVALFDVRGYRTDTGSETTWSLTSGPGLTTHPSTRLNGQSDPMVMTDPQMFAAKPNKWTRFFVRLEHNAGDWDYIDWWVSDEDRAAVQIFNRVPVSVGLDTDYLEDWGLEFNTSTDNFVSPGRGNNDLVMYTRNWSAHQATGVASASTLDDSTMATLVARKPVRG